MQFNIKYRERGTSARRANTSLAHRLRSYLTLLTSHFAVRIHSISFYVHTYSIYTHDKPNSFNVVRDTPHGYMIIQYVYISTVGRDSSVGIAIRYGLEGPWIESRWGARFSAPIQTGPGAHPASCTMGTGFLPGVKVAGA
jgi:hypothetical protein